MIDFRGAVSKFYTIGGVDVYQKEFCALIRMLIVLLWHGRKALRPDATIMQYPFEDFLATTLFRIRKEQKQNAKQSHAFSSPSESDFAENPFLAPCSSLVLNFLSALRSKKSASPAFVAVAMTSYLHHQPDNRVDLLPVKI